MEAAPQGSIPLDQKRRKQFESAAFRKFQRAKKEGGDSPPELLPSGEFIGEKCHGVVCQMLPPNSSHFLQPLDNVVFATLKNQAGTIYNDTKAAFDAMQLRYPRLLERAAAAAFDVAFKPSLIKAAWKNVGIWPFSPEIIEARALKQTGGGPVNKFTGKEKGAKKSNGG